MMLTSRIGDWPKGPANGLDHDLCGALHGGVVSFWARERLHEKMAGMIQKEERLGVRARG